MIRLWRWGLLLALAIFLSRAFFVSVVMGEYYGGLAKGNRIKVEPVPAPRGVIMDRKGKILASNIEVEASLPAGRQVVRYYPDGEVIAGVVGYLSDGKGMAGLEKQYEERLKGEAGERLVEESAQGKEVREIKVEAATAGQDLKLNLDLGLQTSVYRALKQRLGAGGAGAVVVARTNGEILALVSLPSFDPNLFIVGGKRGQEGGIYPEAAAVLADEVRQPLFNRVTAGAFAPGSVYKLIPAIAGLEEGVVRRGDLIEDTGEIKIGIYRYGNWYFDQYGRKEGMINIERALARSNDVFFYHLGERLGVDRLVAWSERFGLGRKTGIDFPGEVAGLLPTPLWSEKEKGERWFLGNTYHLVIGQGDLQVTPLQMNRVTGTAVTGAWCRPRLAQGEAECRDLGLAASSREVVIAGMRQACQSGGTAFPFFDLKGAVICKTGTAQHGGEETKPHAWINVVLPTREGQFDGNSVVVTVMLEAAGEGSYEAAPLARRVVDYLRAENQKSASGFGF